jgi:mono/diheme cytochrome c family protein
MKNRTLKLILFAAMLLLTGSACGSSPAPTPTPLPSFEGQQLPTENGELFAASGACASCHSNLTDEGGSDVSMDVDWRAAMMANAARDPYWQASVRLQVADYPHLADVIEEKCATCHTPMAHVTAREAGEGSPLLDDGFLQADHELHTLAMDGVSCSVCHQIEEDNLGTPDSFSGRFSVDTERPVGERLIYGPFPSTEDPAQVMQDVSGYRPVEAAHTGRSELCAACHTLYTPYVDGDGEIAGTFPEQVPYLEWQHSDYEGVEGCQDCHMPPADGAVPLASMGGGPPRSPFSRHLFIGGNAYMLKMLQAFGEEIGVTASSEHFQRKLDQTMVQLQDRSAALTVGEAALSEGQLTLAVSVETKAGHKVPTGFPSRRAWLHVTVEDADGNIVFESGGYNADGSILGNANDAEAGAYEPHYAAIEAPDQVQIYETILEDVSGEITTGLLAAKGYRKDNRLLPSGFDKTTADADFGVYGAALDDEDFAGGGDTTRYAIALDDAEGPLSVEVELLYQSISFRWAENLRAYEAPEAKRFIRYYEAVPNEPVVMATATIRVGE